MSVGRIKLDDHLCFALYTASRAVIAAERPGLRELGLTYPQYLVMLVLWDEREVPIGRLCERLQLDSGTVSPLVRRLETMGHVARRRSPDDERSTIVSLTASGDELGAKADCVLAAFADALFGDQPSGATEDPAVAGDSARDDPRFGFDDVVDLRTALHHLTNQLRADDARATERMPS